MKLSIWRQIIVLFLCLAPTLLCAKNGLQVGDCVIFREGGDGRIFKTPTYWLKGSIAKILKETKKTDLCPNPNKPVRLYSHEDWINLINAQPCVEKKEDMGVVDVYRLYISVNDWETPWSIQHRPNRWLYQGRFLNQILHKGKVIEMYPAWLSRCDS